MQMELHMAEKTFESFMASERERLNKAREEIYNKQQELQQKLDAVNAELRAIDAYEAVKTGKPLPGTAAPAKAPRAARASTGTRRGGVRDEILAIIKEEPMTRGEILTKKGIVEKDNKAGAQSVSNALSAMKKAGIIKQGDDGKYMAA
jgi:hypothetical protein